MSSLARPARGLRTREAQVKKRLLICRAASRSRRICVVSMGSPCRDLPWSQRDDQTRSCALSHAWTSHHLDWGLIWLPRTTRHVALDSVRLQRVRNDGHGDVFRYDFELEL
nr:hypothetical protein CFP56_00731 [Quercus suber]